MLKLRKIAVTGGLASGKSTVCQMLHDLGAYTVSADEIVHQLLSPDTVIGKQIITIFGSEILCDQRIDRKKIAQQVFSSPEKLRVLEQILHPAVFDEIDNRYQRIKHEGKHPLFVAEIPLLYESQSKAKYDAVISVVADESLCKERFLKKSKLNEKDFEERIQHQFDQREKALRADYVIYNNGSLDELRENVRAIFLILTAD